MGIRSINFACSKYQLKAIANGRDLKNKNGSLHLYNGLQFLTIINLNGRVYFVTFPRHLMEPRTRFFQVNLRNINGLIHVNEKSFTDLQANCITIWQMRKHTTPTRPQLTNSDYFVFSVARKRSKVLTNQSASFIKARFQNKN